MPRTHKWSLPLGFPTRIFEAIFDVLINTLHILGALNAPIYDICQVMSPLCSVSL